MLYLFMKLHVSAKSGHHQVSHQLRGIVVISMGCGVEISTCHPLFYYACYSTISVRRRNGKPWGGNK
jgi:hypothetical protein